MINFNTVKVYDWFDIEGAIADRVGVENLYGRMKDGEYQNFWHIALACIIPSCMSNDTIVTLYGIEDWESNKEYYIEEHGKWTEVYFKAYYDIMQELDPDFNGIQVKFSW